MSKSDQVYTKNAHIISLIKWGIFKGIFFWNKGRSEPRNEKGIVSAGGGEWYGINNQHHGYLGKVTRFQRQNKKLIGHHRDEYKDKYIGNLITATMTILPEL